jgi:hypothetical protein
MAVSLAYLVDTAKTQLVSLLRDVLHHDVMAPPALGELDDELPSAPSTLASSHATPALLAAASRAHVPSTAGGAWGAPSARARTRTASGAFTASAAALRSVAAPSSSSAGDGSGAGQDAPLASSVSPFELTLTSALGAARGARTAHSASGLVLAAALGAQREATNATDASAATSGQASASRRRSYQQADRLFAALCYLCGYVQLRSGLPRRAMQCDLQRAALLLRHGEAAASLPILTQALARLHAHEQLRVQRAAGGRHHPLLGPSASAPLDTTSGGSSGLQVAWVRTLAAAAQLSVGGSRCLADGIRSSLSLCAPSAAPGAVAAWLATCAQPNREEEMGEGDEVGPLPTAPSSVASLSSRHSMGLLQRGGLEATAAAEALEFLAHVARAATAATSTSEGSVISRRRSIYPSATAASALNFNAYRFNTCVIFFSKSIATRRINNSC